jgi:hypothetical protein
MKTLAILTAAALTLFSVAAYAQYGGPYYGKGKAPRRHRFIRKASANWGDRHCAGPFLFGGP